jgi:hypothetical protein
MQKNRGISAFSPGKAVSRRRNVDNKILLLSQKTSPLIYKMPKTGRKNPKCT